MSSPYLPIMPISKVISRISLQRVPAKELQGIQQIEDRIYSWPHDLEFEDGHLTQPIPGQAVQILGCLHLQDRMEMLLGRLHVADQAVKASAHTVSAGPGDRTPWSGADSPWKAYQSRCWSLSKTMHHVIPVVLSLLLSSRSRLHLCWHQAHPLM
mgnify:CR=1 FL=1